MSSTNVDGKLIEVGGWYSLRSGKRIKVLAKDDLDGGTSKITFRFFGVTLRRSWYYTSNGLVYSNETSDDDIMYHSPLKRHKIEAEMDISSALALFDKRSRELNEPSADCKR